MTKIVAIVIVVMVAICAVAIGVVMGSAAQAGRALALLLLIIPGVLVAILLAYCIPVAAHEAGHFLAAKALGYKVHYTGVGPFSFESGTRRKLPRFSIENLWYLSGHVVFTPIRPGRTLASYRWVILAGPIASLVLAAVLILIAPLLRNTSSPDPGIPFLWVNMLGWFSLYGGILNLIPFKLLNHSDGFLLLESYRNAASVSAWLRQSG